MINIHEIRIGNYIRGGEKNGVRYVFKILDADDLMQVLSRPESYEGHTISTIEVFDLDEIEYPNSEDYVHRMQNLYKEITGNELDYCPSERMVKV